MLVKRGPLVTENKEVPWCQICRHWQYPMQRLLVGQLPMKCLSWKELWSSLFVLLGNNSKAIHSKKLILFYFYTPVFRRDVLWYGAVRPSVRPSVRSSVRPTVSTKKHRCKWRIFFKFCTQVCLGVPSINLLFVLSYLIKYAHNSIISDFSIFGIHRVIF